MTPVYCINIACINVVLVCQDLLFSALSYTHIHTSTHARVAVLQCRCNSIVDLLMKTNRVQIKCEEKIRTTNGRGTY